MRKIVFLPILFVLVWVFGGCSQSPQLTRQQWIELTTRTYTHTSEEAVYTAAEKLFRLADGNDFVISYYKDGMVASRKFMDYLLVADRDGVDTWRLTTKDLGGGKVQVSVEVGTQKSNTFPAPTLKGDLSIYTTPALETPAIQGTALYDLFWKRMDYLMGKSKVWTTCKDADALLDDKTTWGTLAPLCDPFNTKDNSPIKK
jgi:hypothetical protein